MDPHQKDRIEQLTKDFAGPGGIKRLVDRLSPELAAMVANYFYLSTDFYFPPNPTESPEKIITDWQEAKKTRRVVAVRVCEEDQKLADALGKAGMPLYLYKRSDPNPTTTLDLVKWSEQVPA